MRAGSLGSQRFGMVPWTGDVDRSWGGLKPQVELALQMGLFGFGWIHSDLGGFAGGEEFDPELYIRWLQYGVFQPVYRPHAQEHIAPEPVFHGSEVVETLRPWLELRYRLLPYNYTLAYQHSQTGMPLMRPLFFLDEQNLALRDEANSYLWGDAFLVAPVTEPGVRSWPVHLPKGVWFDFFTGERIEGGAVVTRPVNLDTIPVLVKAGSFIPMTDAIERTRDYHSKALTLHYYADASVSESQGELFEDDGVTVDAVAKGQYELLRFAASQQQKQLTLNFSREGGDYTGRPASRDLTLVLHNQRGKARKVYLDGRYIPIVAQPQRFARGQNIAWYDKANKQLHIKVPLTAETKQLQLRY
ncbi:glycoside hydrolase family 31 protein [Alishewanella longhuensis]